MIEFNREELVEAWVSFVIFVGNKGLWSIVGQMLRAYVYHVTGMSTLQMLCLSATHEPYYVKDAIHSLHFLGALKKGSRFVKIVI